MSSPTTLIAPERLVVNSDSVLVRFTPEDYPESYRVVDQNRDFLARWEHWAPDFTLESARRGNRLQHENALKGISAPYKLVHRGETVAGMSLFDREGERAELGYWGVRAIEGQSIMYPAVDRLVDFGLNEWGLSVIRLEIKEGNERSVKLACRLGAVMIGKKFTREANSPVVEEIWKISRHER